MKILLKIISILLFFLLVLAFIYRKDIYKYIRQEKIYNETIIIDNNSYAKNYSYDYVKLTDDFIADNKDETINILYTIINSGTPTFTFYCDSYYDNCINDFREILNNNEILSSINNFVHPYNSFSNIDAIMERDKITITITKKYSDNDITILNNKVNEIINKEITSNMSNTSKIEKIHDYIINNSYYYKSSDTESGKANDVLLKGYGICSSYTDAMALFLSEFGLDNYKISTDNHIWNLVYINNDWLHLDLTYDDPVVSDGSNMLLKEMFLINANALYKLNDKNHYFDKTIYSEAK